MTTQYIDLHIHPAMKPMGKSFDRGTPGVNNPNKNAKDSIWYYDPPTPFDKLANIFTSLTKFRQSDFTSLAKKGAPKLFLCRCADSKKGL